MTPKTRNRIFLAIAAIIAVMAVTIYMVWNKPHKNIKGAEAVSITAEELYTSFTKDSAGANKKYTDKVLLVSGEVSQVSENQQAQQVILLKTALGGASVNCTMEEKAAACKAGERVTIKGVCSGYISGDEDMGLPGDVFLIRGYLSNGK